jgi:hypothetical protein
MIPDLLTLLFWHRLPLAVARVSPSAAGVLADGVYMVHGTGVGALGPIVATVLGLIAGTRHQGQAFTASLITMAVLATVGMMSAQLGVWATAGYLLGDVLLRDRPGLGFSGLAALLVAGVLLTLLTVYVPLLVGAARLAVRRVDERGQPPAVLEALTGAAAAAAAVAVWAVATRVLIRPVYAWQGVAPTVAELAPLSQRWLVLVGVAALAAAFRVWREEVARGEMVRLHVAEMRVDLSRIARRREVRRHWTPGRPVRVAALAALLMVVVAGLVGSVVQALLAFVFLAAVIEARHRMAGLAWPVGLLRTPAWLRAGVVLAVGYGLAGLILAVTNGVAPALASTCLIVAMVTLAAAKSTR